tara:strand:+ start:166 stop:363 length:198 start_codon:yes stop_codon:yes gene_type:complete
MVRGFASLGGACLPSREIEFLGKACYASTQIRLVRKMRGAAIYGREEKAFRENPRQVYSVYFREA